MLYPTPIAKLIDSFSKLPGIGAKTATRLAFYTISMSDGGFCYFSRSRSRKTHGTWLQQNFH